MIGIVSGKRSEFVPFGYPLAEDNFQLAKELCRHVLEGHDPSQIDGLFVAQTLPCFGQQAYFPRTLARALELSAHCVGHLVNGLCASGLCAVQMAMDALNRGDIRYALVLAYERPDQAPHQLWHYREKAKGRQELRDSLEDHLSDPYDGKSIAQCMEEMALNQGVTRQMCDDYAAFEWEKFQKKPAELRDFVIGKSAPIARKSKATRELFPTGICTNTNSAGLTSGAAAILLTKDSPAKSMALIKGLHIQGVPQMAMGGHVATESLLRKLSYRPSDIDFWEYSDSFAASGVVYKNYWCQQKVAYNPWSSSLCYGHPFGATGIRMLLHLARMLELSDKNRAVGALPAGGAQGAAFCLEKYKVY